MTLTGAGTRVVERVELMALLWQLLDGDAAYCANPRLLMVTRLLPELRAMPATAMLEALRVATPRDKIIKGLVADAHGLAVPEAFAELGAALDALSGQWLALAEGLAAPLHAAYGEMQVRAGALAEGLDPAADMAVLTGERDRLRVIVTPSLFLPPPQNGRHSALVETPAEGATAYLFYGFPLDDDPAQFGISRYWLLGGAWHYAVNRFVARHWPALAAELRDMPAIEAALTEALAEHRESVVWPQVIGEHLSMGIKCALCAHAGMPELVHRGFARTQGMAFFGWFRSWIAELGLRPERFVAELERLPRLLDANCDTLVDLARAAGSGPASINFALATHQNRPVIVLPDHWDPALRDRIARRWSRVSGTLLSESEWQDRGPQPDASLIAFGQVGRDRTVDALLARRRLELAPSPEGGDVLVSLFPPHRARHPWEMAVAVHDPEVAGNFAAEHVLGLFHSTARFAGYRFVEGDGMALSA